MTKTINKHIYYTSSSLVGLGSIWIFLGKKFYLIKSLKFKFRTLPNLRFVDPMLAIFAIRLTIRYV